MKNLTTISLFIFGVILVSILTAGLVFSQNKKNNQAVESQSKNIIQDTLIQNTSSGKSLILSIQEVAKHNSQLDCWMLISVKVYNITSYFGSHPGGSGAMTATCGKDATTAYLTKDPYATSSGNRSSHSSRAVSLLDNYYIGDLNQTIGQQKVIQTSTVVAPIGKGDGGEYDD